MGCTPSKSDAKQSKGIKLANEDDEVAPYKILIIGDAGVGKSSLLLRFVDDVFTEAFISTLGVDYKEKRVIFDSNNVNLHIWDTAGQERFRTITTSYYRGAHGIIVAYDIGDQKSFNNITRWCKEIDTFGAKNVKKILVGGKSDLSTTERKVSKQDGEDLASKLKIPFVETSSKDNHCVYEAFLLLVNEILKK